MISIQAASKSRGGIRTIIELVSNASDAIHARSRDEKTAGLIRVMVDEDDRSIMVRDNGSGMGGEALTPIVFREWGLGRHRSS
jgi:C4-dicarboxylate-specific signal transduction histidine kinase